MSDTLPPALREALMADLDEGYPLPMCDVSEPYRSRVLADRACCMAAALRWAKSMYAAFNSDDADGVLERNIAALEQDAVP